MIAVKNSDSRRECIIYTAQVQIEGWTFYTIFQRQQDSRNYGLCNNMKKQKKESSSD